MARASLALVLLLLVPASPFTITSPHALFAQNQPPAAPRHEPAATQIIRASDWKGAVQAEAGAEECTVASGEFTYWVYAAGTQCGVPREQADRIVLIRQPTLGVAPLTVKAQLPGGRYAVWVYGAGQPGHPWIHVCGAARTCGNGELSSTPGWVFLGWIQIRDNQLLQLRSWQQPVSHRLHIQAVVLSSSETRPDWVP